MFDPDHWEDVINLKDHDLASLPQGEDKRHEYKSSAVGDRELLEKIGRAASGFWNSGGGLFVAGVSSTGQPDGGLPLAVGRQSRRDWVDQAITRVSPHGRYAVKCIDDGGAGLQINPRSAVVAIGFAASDSGPHMAPDNRYYLRAGAHTLPASHFIVEAIRTRRGLLAPMLRHVVRRKPEGGGVLQVGIVSLNDAPALSVEINLNPVPEGLQKWPSRLPIIVPVISRQTPFYLDFHILTMNSAPHPPFEVLLNYTDLADRQHRTTLSVDVDKQMGPNFGSGNQLRDLERAVVKVAEAISRKK